MLTSWKSDDLEQKDLLLELAVNNNGLNHIFSIDRHRLQTDETNVIKAFACLCVVDQTKILYVNQSPKYGSFNLNFLMSPVSCCSDFGFPTVDNYTNVLYILDAPKQVCYNK